MKKRALCPLSGVHLTIKPKFGATFRKIEMQKHSKQQKSGRKMG